MRQFLTLFVFFFIFNPAFRFIALLLIRKHTPLLIIVFLSLIADVLFLDVLEKSSFSLNTNVTCIFSLDDCCANKLVASSINRTNHIKSWSSRINDYFSFVNFRSSLLCIVSCTLPRHKTMFIPLLKSFVLCTEIEHELEHDRQKIYGDIVYLILIISVFVSLYYRCMLDIPRPLAQPKTQVR